MSSALGDSATPNAVGVVSAPDRRTRDRFAASDEITPLDLPRSKAAWERFYIRGLIVTDLAALGVAIACAEVAKFGLDSMAQTGGLISISYTGLGILIALLWWAWLLASKTHDRRVIGHGVDEYRRIVRTTVLVFGWVAITSVMLKIDTSRGYLAIAFPLGLVLLLVNRKLWRIWLCRNRAAGRHVSRVLVIGGIRSALHVTTMLDKHPGSGMRVSGVWVPDREVGINEWLDVPERFIPVMGIKRTLAGAMTITDADIVMVTDTEHLGADGLRELTWQLEGVDVQLLVSPNVVDVADSRIHMRAVATMPLLQVEEPQYAEAGSWPKVLFDRTVAGLLLVMFSPLLVGTAIAVKLTSPGPVFYYQERIGRRGEPFKMTKFRSMRTGADAELASLLAEQGTADKPLFKVTNDPRITKVGGFIRRFSIDELPQLLNVLKGDMSLVGPRPQQQAEVDLYDDKAHRRLTVRPGMTGLWQVSGRSDLSWEEAIRLDTSYVENWSMIGDLLILWRTVRAVLGSDGAY